jgi:hypothetical protein
MTERQIKRDKAERKRDETIEQSFPASDPPANSGITGPGSPRTRDKVTQRAPNERGMDERPTGHPTSDRHATETAHVWENEEQPPAEALIRRACGPPGAWPAACPCA